MRATLSLYRREFAAYFQTPVAYVVLGAFLLGTGLLFRLTLQLLTARGPRGVEFPMQGLFGNVGFWLIFWVIPPLLTMRLFAEERSTGTLEMLMTAPLTDGQVVLAKFLACSTFLKLMMLPTLLYLPVLLDIRFDWPGWSVGRGLAAGGVLLPLGVLMGLFTTSGFGRSLAVFLLLAGLASLVAGCVMLGVVEKAPFATVTTGLDAVPAVTAYLGVVLSGGMFLALGLWVSSLVRSQVVAALLSLALNLVFLLGGLLVLGGLFTVPADAGGFGYQALLFLSVPLHVKEDWARGLVDTRQLVLYLSVTFAALFLTVRSVESRRWQ